MGVARIVSGGSLGSYWVEVLFARAAIDAEIARITADLEALAEPLAAAEVDFQLAELEVEEAALALNAMIDAFEDGGPAAGGENMLALHNDIRSARGLSSLSLSGALSAAAQGHAEYLRNFDIMSHTGEGGSKPAQRAGAEGFSGDVGENAAGGYPTAEELVPGWMGSPGHRANIIDPAWTQMGYGYAYCPGGLYKHFWVVLFGVPA